MGGVVTGGVAGAVTAGGGALQLLRPPGVSAPAPGAEGEAAISDIRTLQRGYCSTAAAATLQLTIGYPVHHSIVSAAVQRCTLHTAPPQYGIQLVFILVYCVDSLSVDRR